MAGVSSPVTVSAGLAVELYLVRLTLDQYSADGGTDESTLATLSLLEVCLEKAISLTLDSVDAEFWHPIQHWEKKAYFWLELAATIVDPESRESIARAAFGELVWRLRFLTTKYRGHYLFQIPRLRFYRLKGTYKWEIFEFPQEHVLSGFQIVFGQHGRIHMKIGSQWSVKVWEIKIDGNFLEMAGIRKNLEFVKEKCEIINEMQDKGRERPYDIMLNWLVGRPDMTSVESFQGKSGGISRTISLELGVATDHLPGPHEGIEMAGIYRERILERAREDTSRGVPNHSNDSKFMTDSCYLYLAKPF
jgi:hypothetical protein